MESGKQKISLIESLTKTQIIALLGAMCIFLSSIEYLIPKPVPFFRYGFANIIILISLRFLSYSDINILALLKVIGLGILNGTFVSYVFIFSLLGTLSSVYLMYFLHKLCKDNISLIGISIIGAMASNTVQIVLAVYFIFGTQAWIIAPYLLVLGLFSGLLVGIVAQQYIMHSHALYFIFKKYSEI